MADKADESIDEVIVAQGGSNKKMIAIVVALFLASNVAWGAITLLGGGSQAAAAQGPGGEEPEVLSEEEQKHIESRRAMDKPGPIVALEPFVVNLDEPRGAHYLRATLKIEIDREESRPHVDEHVVMIRDQFLTILSSKKMAELRTQEDKQALRAELLDCAQDTVSRRAVRAVYFTEFLTQ